MRFMQRSRRTFYGWRMVVAVIPLFALAHGMTQRSYGLLFDPLQKEFGWSAAAIALVFSLDRFEGGLLAPITGYLTDRIGGRIMIFTGMVTIAIGFLLASQVQSLWQFYVAFLIVNTGSSIGSINNMHAVLVHWFRRYLGRALGILNSAPSVGTLLVPFIALLITAFGWRWTLVISAFLILAISVPLSLAIRPNPQNYGLFPDGINPADSHGSHGTTSPDKLTSSSGEATVGLALRTASFWFITLAIGIYNFGQSAQRLLIIPHLQSPGVGFSRELASVTVTVSMVTGGLLTRALMGWIAEKIDVRRVYPLLFIVQGAGLIILANATKPWHVVIHSLVFEAAFSAAITFHGVLIAQIFGARRFASIKGLTTSFGVLVAAAAPVIGGAMFDATESYQFFFQLASGLALLGIPPMLLVKEVHWGTSTVES